MPPKKVRLHKYCSVYVCKYIICGVRRVHCRNHRFVGNVDDKRQFIHNDQRFLNAFLSRFDSSAFQTLPLAVCQCNVPVRQTHRCMLGKLKFSVSPCRFLFRFQDGLKGYCRTLFLFDFFCRCQVSVLQLFNGGKAAFLNIHTYSFSAFLSSAILSAYFCSRFTFSEAIKVFW